jgi:hypothetical protein
VPTRSRCGQGAGGPSSDSARWAGIHWWTSLARASSSSGPNTWRVRTIRPLRRVPLAGGDPSAPHDSPTRREDQRLRPRHYRHRRTGLTGHRSCRYRTEWHPQQSSRTRTSRRDRRRHRLTRPRVLPTSPANWNTRARGLGDFFIGLERCASEAEKAFRGRVETLLLVPASAAGDEDGTPSVPAEGARPE